MSKSTATTGPDGRNHHNGYYPTHSGRAVLVQALPYIQDILQDKIVVIKYGGNAMVNVDLKDAVMGDIVLLVTA